MEPDIVAKACAGDATAFAAIVEEFTPTVLAAAYGWCGDQHLAADIAQEVFATAYVKIATLRDPAALPGWLMAITRSSARVARPGRVAASFDVVAPGVDDEVVAADEARRLRRAVEALPSTERLPMALHYFAGQRLADIAELCDLPLSTVKKRMRTARGRLRQQGSEMIMDNSSLVFDETGSDTSDVVRMYSAMRTGTWLWLPRFWTRVPISSMSARTGPPRRAVVIGSRGRQEVAHHCCGPSSVVTR